MNEWNEQLKEALDMVHMEKSLKVSALDAVLKRRESKRNVWKPAAAMVGMCCLIIMCWGIHLVALPVRYISIDINPSIELGVNRLDRVVRVDAYNGDGEKLTKELPLLFLSSTEAVQTVVDSEDIRNLLDAEEELTLTVVDKNEEVSQDLADRLEEALGKTDNVCCRGVSSLEVKQAHHKGMSYGKYLAYMEAIQNDAQLTIQDARDMTMKEIRSLINTPSQQLTTTDDETVELDPSHKNAGAHRHGKHKHLKPECQ